MHIANFAREEIDESFERIDENGDRSISFDEYARLMLEIVPALSEVCAARQLRCHRQGSRRLREPRGVPCVV